MSRINRFLFSFSFSLLLMSTALAQGTRDLSSPVDTNRAQETTQLETQSSTPILTATASDQRVRYVGLGEVHQMRLQVFSADGTQVYNSDFRLGNLVDWKLVDQQGQPLANGTYLFLVTVKDFSDNLTQKYGTTRIEQQQVSLQQSTMDELSSAEVSALETNRQAKLLSSIDRIGASGSGTTALDSGSDGSTTIDGSTSTKKSKGSSSSSTSGANVTGTGTTNQVTKWTDNAGTLGDSAITEVSGRVGIGNTSPTATLSLGAPGVGVLPSATNIWISGQGTPANPGLQNRISFGVDTNQDYGGYMGAFNFDGTSSGMVLGLGTRGAGFDLPALFMRNGKVGVGTGAPTPFYP